MIWIIVRRVIIQLIESVSINVIYDKTMTTIKNRKIIKVETGHADWRKRKQGVILNKKDKSRTESRASRRNPGRQEFE